MPKPTDYPLPWCEALDVPYWQVNMALISTKDGWRELQRGRSMASLIPEIDALIAERAIIAALPKETDNDD